MRNGRLAIPKIKHLPKKRNFVMFKKFVLAAVPAMMIANSLMANDDLLSMVANLDGAKDKQAEVATDDTLGQKDVDALLGEEKSNGDDAVAACFRNSGHGHRYGSYGSYGSYGNYGCYGNYNSYCYPSYSTSYSCWSPSYCYTPTYQYTVPVSYSCYSPCYSSCSSWWY